MLMLPCITYKGQKIICMLNANNSAECAQAQHIYKVLGSKSRVVKATRVVQERRAVVSFGRELGVKLHLFTLNFVECYF
jgi:uncharacterized protein (DUF1810 family)